MKKLNLISRMKLKETLTLLACLFFLASVANATVIYDNLGSTYDGYDNLTGWIDNNNRVLSPPLYDSFSVGANGFNLLDVQLMLRGTPSTGSLSVAIYNDSSTSPGMLLFTIGTLSDIDLPLQWSTVDFLLASPYALAANTRYWIVLNSDNNSTAEWSWSSDQYAIGVANEFHGHRTWVYENSDGGPYQMRLSDTPLPPSLLLLGSGLAGLGLLRFRKRFKA
jgi:hypothetical protein